MHNHSYIYSFTYDIHNSELCKLESRQIFDKEEKNNYLFSNTKVDPSISPFIRCRFDILSYSNDYSSMLDEIKKINIHIDGFKAEYLVLDGDKTKYPERLNKLKDVGFCIEGDPDYDNPTIIYSICYFENTWYFGILTKHDSDWLKHKSKPCSFSSAINIDIAKTLVSIASKGDSNKRLLDAGCGVGTVMLEACIAGIDIEGCDIHWKACKATRENLAHFNYTANVYRSDLKDINKSYDAAIVDLPYNLFSHSDDNNTLHILESASKLADQLVIVSTLDIKALIKQSGLSISDHCLVGKKGKKFTRNIWVCQKA